jgi:hypothetical protein
MRSDDVKYMLLIYSNPANAEIISEEERNALISEADAIIQELTESGEWIGGEALADPMHTRTVRVRGGVPAITDGPFVEAKEQFAGYCLVECESLERALAIAARWPDARFCAMEVRPIMDTGGLEL